jgi:hypothetical protein
MKPQTFLIAGGLGLALIIGVVSGRLFPLQSGFRNPKSEIAAPFASSLHITERDGRSGFAENPFATPAPVEPWLVPGTTDANTPPGVSPATTVLRSKAEPIVEKDGAAWKITFKP